MRYTSEKLITKKTLLSQWQTFKVFWGLPSREVWKIIDSNISWVGICDRSQEGMRYEICAFFGFKGKTHEICKQKNPIDSKSDNIQHPITLPLRFFRWVSPFERSGQGVFLEIQKRLRSEALKLTFAPSILCLDLARYPTPQNNQVAKKPLPFLP